MAQSKTMPAALSAQLTADEIADGPLQAETARLRALVEEHFDFAWRSLRRLGVPEAAVDDATQQLFAVVARRLAGIDPGRERSFVFGTAVRIAAECRRVARRERDRRAPSEPVTIPDPMPGPDELLDQKRARALLDQVLDRLPLKLRTVLILAEGEGMTMAEIATCCAIPPGTVGSRLRRAREAFEASLKRLRAKDHHDR
jgi:RNA polymerase sigma-70 factor, ECF subfamily